MARLIFRFRQGGMDVCSAYIFSTYLPNQAIKVFGAIQWGCECIDGSRYWNHVLLFVR